MKISRIRSNTKVVSDFLLLIQYGNHSQLNFVVIKSLSYCTRVLFLSKQPSMEVH